jgi:hypothetical protein
VGPGHPLYPIVPLIRDADPEPHRALDPRHIDEVDPDRETARTLRFLAGSGIACPPVNADWAGKVVEHLIRVGYLPRPGADDSPPGSPRHPAA